MLMTPDNFSSDPYAWLTNQISHLTLGFAAVVLPDKWVIWASIAVSYALIEVIQRGL